MASGFLIKHPIDRGWEDYVNPEGSQTFGVFVLTRQAYGTERANQINTSHQPAAPIFKSITTYAALCLALDDAINHIRRQHCVVVADHPSGQLSGVHSTHARRGVGRITARDRV